MGTVAEYLKISLEEARTYIRAEASAIENSVLRMLIDSVKESADNFLNNDFRFIYGEFVGFGDGSAESYTLRHAPAYNVRLTLDDGVVSRVVTATVQADTGVVIITPPPALGTRIVADYSTAQPQIPEKVKLWCLQNIARDYELRTNGLTQQSDAIGLATWSKRDYSDIAQFRKNPGW